MEALGLRCTKVSGDSETKVCDFLATDGSQSYLIEVKTKEEDLSFLLQLELQGEADQAVPLSRSNTISSIIRKAMRQLNSLENAPNSFKLIWFSLYKAFDQEVMQKRVRSTLYGVEDITTFKPGNQLSVSECYYFTYSDFDRFPDLDAVIVEMTDGLELWPNPFSPRRNEFAQSELYKVLKNSNSVLDPVEMERNGICFIADFTVDRKDQAALLEHVKSKYDLPNARVFPFKQHRGYVIVPRSDA